MLQLLAGACARHPGRVGRRRERTISREIRLYLMRLPPLVDMTLLPLGQRRSLTTGHAVVSHHSLLFSWKIWPLRSMRRLLTQRVGDLIIRTPSEVRHQATELPT
jgi:hypothetical protein